MNICQITEEWSSRKVSHKYWFSLKEFIDNFYQCIGKEVSWRLMGVVNLLPLTTQKMKFSIEDFFSKCDQIRSFLPLFKKKTKTSFISIHIIHQVYKFNTQISLTHSRPIFHFIPASFPVSQNSLWNDIRQYNKENI